MLAAFPTPFPDETLYSIVARYGRRFSQQKRLLSLDLFGTFNRPQRFRLLGKLDTLEAAIPDRFGMSVDRLIDDHTLFPYYAPFVPPRIYERLRDAMRTTPYRFNSEDFRPFICQLSCGPKWLRYCPTCASEDRATYGERYWHRLHQAPGVAICPRHKVWLEDSSAAADTSDFITADEAISTGVPARTLNLSDMTSLEHIYLTLAGDSAWLLLRPSSVTDFERVVETYRYLWAETNTEDYSGRVRARSLLDPYMKYYPSSIRGDVHKCASLYGSWRERLSSLAAARPIHPAGHLLFVRYLDLAPKALLSSATPPPFGLASWPCLNPVCADYLTLCVREISIDYGGDDSDPIATIECPFCGFTYSRAGPDSELEDLYRWESIVSFGPVWVKAFNDFMDDSSMSLREMAQRLGVDLETVKSKVLTQYGKNVAANDETRIRESRQIINLHDTDICLRHRRDWLTLTTVHPELGRKALRQKLPRIYSWLYHNDGAWLERNCPPSASGRRRKRVDWRKLNRTIAEAAPEAAESIRRNSWTKMERVTVASLARELGQLRNIQKNADKLPDAVAALKREAETREAFAIRRIEHVYRKLPREDRAPRRWQLIRAASLHEELLENSEVEAALQKQLDTICASPQYISDPVERERAYSAIAATIERFSFKRFISFHNTAERECAE